MPAAVKRDAQHRSYSGSRFIRLMTEYVLPNLGLRWPSEVSLVAYEHAQVLCDVMNTGSLQAYAGWGDSALLPWFAFAKDCEEARVSVSLVATILFLWSRGALDLVLEAKLACKLRFARDLPDEDLPPLERELLRMVKEERVVSVRTLVCAIPVPRLRRSVFSGHFVQSAPTRTGWFTASREFVNDAPTYLLRALDIGKALVVLFGGLGEDEQDLRSDAMCSLAIDVMEALARR
jgi:hypothetical protein